MTLILVAHGTRSAAGQAQVQALASRVGRPVPDVRLSYVDVQTPRLDAVVSTVDRAVVVPLLLTAGYHVRVDIASAIAGTSVVATPPLHDERLTAALAQRVAAAGPADAVVLAAAGSSDPHAQADIAEVARAFPCHVAYASPALSPRVRDVVAGLRSQGAERIVVAAYLLVDGLFHRYLHEAGADAVTAPLITHPAVTDLVLRRYRTAASTLMARR